MAFYKNKDYLTFSSHAAFDQLHNPGAATPYSGIYRCERCGHEDACNAGNPLPPQNHHQHSPPAPIQWRLIVGTQ